MSCFYERCFFIKKRNGGRYIASYYEFELKICSCFLVISRNYICKEAFESMFNDKFVAPFCPLETEGITAMSSVLYNTHSFRRLSGDSLIWSFFGNSETLQKLHFHEIFTPGNHEKLQYIIWWKKHFFVHWHKIILSETFRFLWL